MALLAAPLLALQLSCPGQQLQQQQRRPLMQQQQRGAPLLSSRTTEAPTAKEEALPELLDDAFGETSDSGEEDLLASFDLENADVGEIMQWDEAEMDITIKQLATDRATHGRHPTDCGSPEVQIAMFTTRIKHITAHVIANPKDHGSRRGLLALVSKRRRLLHYLYKNTPEHAEKLVASLGVRFRFRNDMPDRIEKYREFTIKANKRK